jgi:hypothetical protein
MDNASTILLAVDEHLDHPLRLIIYGRAALQLGFANPPPEAAHSKDVDCIVPLEEVKALAADENFWIAQEAANLRLRPRRLYLTHLFRADQVILQADWLRHLVPIRRPPLRWLRLFRPATLDLILTKMMRGEDPQDMADAAFLIRHDRVTTDQLESAFAAAVIPDLAELRDAFQRAQARLRVLVREASA